MKMKNKLSLVLLAALLCTAPALLAQTVHFNNVEEYNAWKAQQAAQTPATPPAHPAPPEGAPGTERDGVASCNCWITPNASYTTINNNTQWNASGFGNGDDGSYGPINLPFSFYLYGQYYTQAYININGNISFGTYNATYSSSSFPMSGPALVAPFWADVDLRGGNVNQNKVQFKVTPTALYVNWTNVGYYSMQTDKLNSFQVIITNGADPVIPGTANVSFCYGTMQWTTGSASGGTNGFGGTAATVGANKGDGVNYIQFGRFDHAGTNYNGPFGAPGGVGWLTGKSFNFSTDITTGNIAPVVAGQSVCDTLEICTGVPTQLNVDFLSPEPNQITTATSTAPTLSNYTIVSNTSGNTASITTQVLAALADTGYHVVTFSGTDNGTPVQTSNLNIVIHVIASPQLVSNTLAVCDNAAPVDMLTVLGGNAPAGGTWTAPNGTGHTAFFNPLADAPGVYSYAVSAGGQCEATGTATMSIVQHVNAGNDLALAYCSSDSPDPLFPHLTGNPEAGGAWSTPAGTAFNGTVEPATFTSGIYTYLVAGTGPCPNDTAFITLAIPQAVHAGTDGSATLCRDAAPFSMRSKLGGAPDATGQWTADNGDAAPDLFNPATGTAGTYTYTVQAIAPCPGPSAQLIIHVDPLPNAGLDSALVICANGNPTPLFPLLGGSPDAGGQWLKPDGGPLPDGMLLPATNLPGNYRYVAIGPGTCAHRTDTALVQVQINPVPVITFTAAPDSGCAPLEVTFTNTTDSVYIGNFCQWDPGDGTGYVETCGTFTHTYTDAGWYHVKLKVTTPQGCTDQLIVPGAVLVDPAPKATFVFTPNPGTAGNSKLVFSATDPHAVDFLWTFPNSSVQTGQQATYLFPDDNNAKYQVCLNVADRYGCQDTFCDSVPIVVRNLWVPNAFTPDGNGINDVFKPVMMGLDPSVYHLMVFNRWGGLVFESTDPEKGWDGTRGGSQVPAGVYIWRITYRPMHTADLQEKFGTITLQR